MALRQGTARGERRNTTGTRKPSAPQVPTEAPESGDYTEPASLQQLRDALDEREHDIVRIGALLLQARQEMQEQLSRYLNTVDRYNPSKAPYRMSEAEFSRMLQSFTQETPPWIQRIIEYATQVRRHPTVRWEDVGAQIGLAERTMRTYIRISKLPKDVQESIASGEISHRNAIAIAGIKDPEQVRKVASEVVTKGFTSSKARRYARQVRNAEPAHVPALQDLVAAIDRNATALRSDANVDTQKDKDQLRGLKRELILSHRNLISVIDFLLEESG
ncbi:MAG TPA: hypothetical protein VF600_08890 [Abditibacteriaceae bacterium]|jgi:hypothetical protein